MCKSRKILKTDILFSYTVFAIAIYVKHFYKYWENDTSLIPSCYRDWKVTWPDSLDEQQTFLRSRWLLALFRKPLQKKAIGALLVNNSITQLVVTVLN